MKYLKGNSDLCTGCLACADACSELFFKEKNIQKSCIRINQNDNKNNIIVCNQCGKCMPLCPTQALSYNSQGVVILDKNECSGCLICVAECPCACMHYLVEENAPFKCIACGICVKKCPVSALELIKE
ncbi:MAG: 4Fe-4S binding protein [Candidatus Cloacimonetes bacterium]|nr:4Fe-4S binding protein [Candidatus Cloacimonadota bacterium]